MLHFHRIENEIDGNDGTGGRDITKIYEENIPFKMPMVPSKDASIAMNRCFEQCNL